MRITIDGIPSDKIQLTTTRLKLYSDGSSRGNPGRGGWGCVILPSGSDRIECYQGYRMTTNNRMELLGVITPLELIKDQGIQCQVMICSDSRYVCDAVNKGWIKGWLRRGWVTASKTPVKNKDLWLRMLGVIQYHSTRFVWVKGHNEHPMNEYADILANQGVLSPDLINDNGFQG